MSNYKANFQRDGKLFDALSKSRVLCECSHSIFIPNFMDRTICSYCGKWVYRNKELEFKYKMLEKMKENGNDDGNN